MVLEIYKETRSFPSEEKFGIVSQIRKSASSISTNIVEGHKRKSTKDYLHFLNMADSSLEETKYLLLLSKDLTYLKESIFQKLSFQCDEIGKMLSGLQKNLTPYTLSLTPTHAKKN